MRRLLQLIILLFLPMPVSGDVERVPLRVNVELAGVPLPGPGRNHDPAVLQLVNRGDGADAFIAGDSETRTFDIEVEPGRYDVFVYFRGAAAPGRRPIGQYRVATSLDIDADTKRLRFVIGDDVTKYIAPQVKFDEAWQCDEPVIGAHLHFVSRDGPAATWIARPATELRIFKGRYDVWAACALSGPGHRGWAKIATNVDPSSQPLNVTVTATEHPVDIDSEQPIVELSVCAEAAVRARCGEAVPFDPEMSLPVPGGPQRLIVTMRGANGHMVRWDAGRIKRGELTRRIKWARARIHLEFGGEPLQTEVSIRDEPDLNLIRTTPEDGRIDLHVPAGVWLLEAHLPSGAVERRKIELKPGRTTTRIALSS